MVTNYGSIQNAQLAKDYLTQQAEQGKLWLEVGTGNDSWDSNIPEPTKDISKLTNGIHRVAIEPTDIQYVIIGQGVKNPDDDVVSTDPTSIIRVLGNVAYPLKPLREYGLFCDGTETVGSGLLYLYDRHPKIVLAQLQLYMKYIYINF